MLAHLLKWFYASLVPPIILFIFGRLLSPELLLFFWPGSLFFMSLGAESRPLTDVIYVWSLAVGSNIFIYLCIGSIFYYFKTNIKKKINEDYWESRKK